MKSLVNNGKVLKYTNPSAVTAIDSGAVVVVGAKLGVAISTIAVSAIGALSFRGVHRLTALTAGAWSMGDPLWWDLTNKCLTRLGDPAHAFAGIAAEAKVVTSQTTCMVDLNRRDGVASCLLNRLHIDSAVDLTLVAATHSGGVIKITADAKTVTLPTGVAGMEFVIVNDVADGGSLLTVDLDGNEIIAGPNGAMAATKTFINAKATQRKGDFIHLICNVAATSWRIVGARGVWAATA